MKSVTIILISVVLMGIAVKTQAQTDSTKNDSLLINAQTVVQDSVLFTMKQPADDSLLPAIKPLAVKEPIPHNIIKVNLFGIALQNYQLQYERVINRKFSVAVAYRFMPVSSIPFKNTIIKVIDDPETADDLNNLKVGNHAFTSEMRLYLSKKGYGRGFYVAPFYRNTAYTLNGVSVNYDTDDGGTKSVDVSGKLSANSGGLLLGVQKAIGKHIVIDWWLIGPQWGNSKVHVSGTFKQTLSPDEQESLKNSLEDIDIPIGSVSAHANVTSNSASEDIDGPWAGYRGGINIGVRF